MSTLIPQFIPMHFRTPSLPPLLRLVSWLQSTKLSGKRVWLALSMTLVLVFFSQVCFQQAEATTLPPGVLNYIQQKDAKVQVRFDGVVTFSNGQTYLPVIPQDPDINPDPVGVVNTIPDKADYPDLIQFDNNFFLIRLIQTSSGRLTLPKIANLPIQLKEGLLPQDLVMPNQLFIPDELKIILGELHYKPTLDDASPRITTSQIISKPIAPSAQVIGESGQKILMTYSLDDQALVPVDVARGARLGQIDLHCMPATMAPSLDGKYLYVACMSTSEVVVVDIPAMLVKTRVVLKTKPQDLLVLPGLPYVMVSNRFDGVMSLISTKELLPPGEGAVIPVGGNPGVIANYNTEQVFVADAYRNRIYQVNLRSRSVTRVLTSLKNISAMWIKPSKDGRPEIWVASRTENKVQVLDLANGIPLLTLDVGKRPVGITALNDMVYVLCASGEEIDVIDSNAYQLQTTITMPAGSFPTSFVLSPEEQRLYVSGAGKDGLITVDLTRNALDKPVGVQFRTFALALPAPGSFSPAAAQLPILETPSTSAAPALKPQKASNEVQKREDVLPPQKQQAHAHSLKALFGKGDVHSEQTKSDQEESSANNADSGKPDVSKSDASPAILEEKQAVSASTSSPVAHDAAGLTQADSDPEDSNKNQDNHPEQKIIDWLGKLKLQKPAIIGVQKTDRQKAENADQGHATNADSSASLNQGPPLNMTFTSGPSGVNITSPRGDQTEIRMSDLRAVSQKLLKKWGARSEDNKRGADDETEVPPMLDQKLDPATGQSLSPLQRKLLERKSSLESQHVNSSLNNKRAEPKSDELPELSGQSGGDILK